MRKEKEVRIDKKVYTVYEVRPKDLIQVFNRAKGEGGIKNAFTEDLLPLLANVTMDELEEMFPGDIETLYEALKEVNSAFFKRLSSLAQHPEVKRILNELSKSFLSEFNGISANLFSVGTENPNDTDGASLQ